MRLLTLDSSDVISLTQDIAEENLPPYAILSHVWGPDHEEVTFDDVNSGHGKSKAGHGKLLFCGRQARKDGLDHFWVDTCCINKASHSELSESIISMFRWYRNSRICYVFLDDVSSSEQARRGNGSWRESFSACRWFTRGWTLQELLAPPVVEFFSQETASIGSRDSLASLIANITQIPIGALDGTSLSRFDVEDRVQWAAGRRTKKPEDKVYSLLGILDVSMPVLYGEGLEHALERLKDAVNSRHRQRLDNAASVLIKPTSIASATSEPTVTHSSIHDRLLKSLRYEQMGSRQHDVKNAYATTCAWLLKAPKYLDWVNIDKFSDHRGFFWLKGKPGVGKSTLTKFAYAHACASHTDGDILLSFFFNARGHVLERSTLGMYRSLLYQLVEKMTDRDLRKLLGVPALRAFHDESPPSWTNESIQELFTVAVRCFAGQGRRLTCYVDALDECDEQEIRDMISHFEDLELDSNLYVFFASRHYPTILVRFGLELTVEHQSGHSEDLQKYVSGHLRLGKGKGTFFEDIQTQVLQKANGHFIWAVLVIDMLNDEFRRGRNFAVKKRLLEVPAALSDLFKQILCHDTDNMKDLLLCLQLLLFAKRPLTREEFYFAMITGLESEAPTAWDREAITADDMDRFVYDCSKGLAVLVEGWRPHPHGSVFNVQFIHESVRDFLIKDKGLYELWPDLEAGCEVTCHDKLKQCCQNYLTVTKGFGGFVPTSGLDPMFVTDAAGQLVLRLGPNDLLTVPDSTSAMLREEINASYPFLEYATENIFYHADQAAAEVPGNDFLTNFDLDNWILIYNVIQDHVDRRHTSDAPVPYLLAIHNAINLIKYLGPTSIDWTAVGEPFGHSLLAAVAHRHWELVKIILDPTGSHNLDGIIASLDTASVSPSYRGTPFDWALNRGDKALMELLASSPDLNLDTLEEGKNYLHLAAGYGYASVVNILLARWTDAVNTPCLLYQRTPLSYAAERGHVPVVDSLLRNGAQFALDCEWRSPLSYAAERGQTHVVNVLLQQGACFDGKTERRSPLSYAAQQGHSSVVDSLVKYPTHTDRDSWPRSPLSYATEGGQVSIVKTLIQSGALIDDDHSSNPKPPHKDADYPLLWAVYQENIAIIRILLFTDEKICSLKTLQDAFWFATQCWDFEIMRLLLNQGADINAPMIHDQGRTVLHCAAQAGHEGFVQYFLHRGATVDALDLNSATPLGLAAENGHYRVVGTLFRKGAHIDVLSKPAIALFWTSVRGNNAVVLQLLLDKGFRGIDIPWKDTGLADVFEYMSEELVMTPLTAALVRGHASIVQILLARGAKVNSKDLLGRTPLFLATAMHHSANARREIVELIDAYSPDVKASIQRSAYAPACSSEER